MSRIARECAIDDGEGAVVSDATAIFSCSVTRECGINDTTGASVADAAAHASSIISDGRIGDDEGAAVVVADASAIIRIRARTAAGSIARYSGIEDVEGTAVSVKDAATIAVYRIARDGGIGDGEVAVGGVVNASAVGCRITREGGISDGE